MKAERKTTIILEMSVNDFVNLYNLVQQGVEKLEKEHNVNNPFLREYKLIKRSFDDWFNSKIVKREE